MQNIAFNLFNKAVKPLRGKGLGSNSVIGNVYRSLMKLLMTEQERIVDVEGFKIKVHMSGIDGIGQQLMIDHSYEPLTTEIFKKFIKSGMVVIDVGANIGYYSLLSSTLVRELGMVYAFEPETKNYEMLLENMSLNGFKNIMAFREAISDRSGCVRLYIDPIEAGAHSIHKVRESHQECIRVNSVSLDRFVEDMRTRVDFIKVDVEGAELEVLKGMYNVSKDNKDLVMVMELWPYGLKQAGVEVDEIWCELLNLGFKNIYTLDERIKEAIKCNLIDIKNRGELWKGKEGSSVNLLCLKH